MIQKPNQRQSMVQHGYAADPDPIYDTMIFAHGTSQQTMFAAAVNSSAGKTLDITNMRDNGKLPTGQSLATNEIQTYITMPTALGTASIALLHTILASTTVEFVKENKAPSFTRTLQMMLGASLLIPVTPTTAGDNIAIAQPTYSGKIKVHGRALWLGQNETFFVRITHQNATYLAAATALDGLLIKIVFDGPRSKKLTA
ncbi:MAG: hypothetical protein WBM07_17160 [Chitinivibrionales bacterium]